MGTITSQQLYSDLTSELSGVELNESSAEEMYSVIKSELSSQEEFSEELIEKCASIGFDAVNDLYQKSQGLEIQESYSEENCEDLFSVEDQEIYTTWVGRAASQLKAVAKGTKDAVQYIGRKNSYLRDVRDEGSTNKKLWAAKNGGGILSRFKTGYKSSMHETKVDRANKARENKKIMQDLGKSGESKKGFFGKFKNSQGFMGRKGGISGMKDWAKSNKAQAATAGVVGAAAIGGAGYLAYKALKNRKQAAQANQPNQQNQTHQIQPTVQ